MTDTPLGLATRYKRIMPKAAIEFMDALLKMDPKDRLTTE